MKRCPVEEIDKLIAFRLGALAQEIQSLCGSGARYVVEAGDDYIEATIEPKPDDEPPWWIIKAKRTS